MVHNNSPTNPSPTPSLETATRDRIRALILDFFQRAKALIEAKKISDLADKTCTLYLGKASRASREQCRQALQTRFYLEPEQLHYFFQTSVGEDMLMRLSRLIYLPKTDLEQRDLGSAIAQTAAEPDGLSLLDLLSKLTTSFSLNTERLLITAKQFEQLQQATHKMVRAVQQLASVEAAIEAAADTAVDLMMLPDIRQQGDYGVVSQVLPCYDPNRDRHFRTLLFKPQTWRDGLAPVVIMSHGLGSRPEDMATYAEYLASYGYVVAAVQHPGSDATQVCQMLAGHASEVFEFTDFIDRPLDITYVLDLLQQRNAMDYEGRLNLDSVGLLGHSFGGYTAFALAGAALNFQKLEGACGPVLGAPNFSLFLQCRALGLPRQIYNLRDRRIKAVFALDPVGSEVYGPEGLSQIQVPVFILAGSEDRASPAALEQIRIFPWFTVRDRYLALVEGKSHVNDIHKLMSVLKLKLELPATLNLPDATIPETYTNALSLAFFEVHLLGDWAYQPYLQSRYAAAISQAPFNVCCISTASSEALANVLTELNQRWLGAG